MDAAIYWGEKAEPERAVVEVRNAILERQMAPLERERAELEELTQSAI